MDTMTLWNPIPSMPDHVLERVMALPETPWRHDLLLGWSYDSAPDTFLARLGELEVLAAAGHGAAGMGIPASVLERALRIPTHHWAEMLAVAYQANRSDFEWTLVKAEGDISRSERPCVSHSLLLQRLKSRLANALRRFLLSPSPVRDAASASSGSSSVDGQSKHLTPVPR
ncbi:hypothetical protein [Stenotrophomonas rhizophila]|uniref:hypothetical protein n=1 Tax=Stenotrophomonas rhizophila TaxID=216778 RepID=UPI00112F0341|nr:hypothetical protein [Stenotrophomonas rhizophila]